MKLSRITPANESFSWITKTDNVCKSTNFQRDSVKLFFYHTYIGA